MSRILATLNRRLDACYDGMETTWEIYQHDRNGNQRALNDYLMTLRRANRLWAIIKTLTPTS